MNAKKIKDILIAYLKAKHREVRIYQEKSIGSSICDVMAVTDKLIGFEKVAVELAKKKLLHTADIQRIKAECTITPISI